jgi:ATP-dependent DNA helicase PIF1
MRRGDISPAAKQTFIGLSRPLPQNDGILPTELFPLRVEVDRANAARMTSLTGPSFKYEARDTGAAPPDKRARLLEAMVATRLLELKEGAQVMLIKNVDESLVNGSVGKILGFYAPSVCTASTGAATLSAPATPQVKKETVATSGASKDPKPKSKSGSLDVPGSKTLGGFVRNIQLGPDGRTPVALYPSGKENTSPPVSPVKGKAKAKDEELLPLVEFSTPQGKEVVLLARDEFRSEDNEGKLLARRVQV